MSSERYSGHLTEERLRTWLDSNQVQRERLCAALLPLLGSYTNVRMRRPKGGPDGSRDLEATYGGTVEAWGGVGFRNQVSDSPADKKWTVKKFTEDLAAAKSERPDLTVFFFFTNVDLTPKEVAKLKGLGAKLGVPTVEVFYRERLRLVLNSVQGMPYRLEFLDIEMTVTEQVAFFRSFGSDLHALIRQGHESIDQKLNVVDFRLACSKPLREFWIFIELDRERCYQDIGHFRAILVLDAHQGIGASPIFVGMRDHIMRSRDHGASEIQESLGIQSFVWRGGKSQRAVRFPPYMWSPSTDRLIACVDLARTHFVHQLDQLHQTVYEFHLSSELVPFVRDITIVANRFVISKPMKARPPMEVTGAGCQWACDLSAEEQAREMKLISLGMFNFESTVPEKYVVTRRDHAFMIH